MIGALIIKRKVPAGFKALDNHDLDTYLKDWADDAVFIYPGDIPGVSGVHTGKAAIRAFYERDLEQFPTIRRTLRSVSVANVFDLTGNNTVAVHWEAEATNRAGFQIQNSGVSVMTIRAGKVTRILTYIFDTGQKFRVAWGEGEYGR